MITATELPLRPAALPTAGEAPLSAWVDKMIDGARRTSLGITAWIVRVTPELARELLKRNEGNRNVRKHHVSHFRQAIDRGEWARLTHQAIAISRTGRVLDGQHRLLAIADSDATVQLIIFFGLEDETFAVIDRGAARTAGDALQQAGLAHTHGMAAAVRCIQIIDAPGYDPHTTSAKAIIGTSPSFVLDFVAKHPLIADAVRIQVRARKHFRYCSAGFAAGLYKILEAGVSIDAVESWAVRVGTGLNVETERAPEYRLRARLQSMGGSVNSSEVAALTIKAWNLRQQRKTIQTLVWSQQESFPGVEPAALDG